MSEIVTDLNLSKLKDKIAAALRKKNLGADEIAKLNSNVETLYEAPNFENDRIYPDYTIPTLAAHRDVAGLVPKLCELRVDLTKADDHGQSPAMTAAAHRARGFLEALHAAGVDLLAPVNGKTALDTAHDNETRIFIADLAAGKLIPLIERDIIRTSSPLEYPTHSAQVSHFEKLGNNIKKLHSLSAIADRHRISISRLKQLAHDNKNQFAVLTIDRLLNSEPGQQHSPALELI